MDNITFNIITLNLSIVNGNHLKFSISLPVFNIFNVKRSPTVWQGSALRFISEATLFLVVSAVVSAGTAVLVLIVVFILVVLVVIVVIVVLVVLVAVSVLILVFVVHNITPLSVLGTLVPYLV